jgi:hypothetical protein
MKIYLRFLQESLVYLRKKLAVVISAFYVVDTSSVDSAEDLQKQKQFNPILDEYRKSKYSSGFGYGTGFIGG